MPTERRRWLTCPAIMVGFATVFGWLFFWYKYLDDLTRGHLSTAAAMLVGIAIAGSALAAQSATAAPNGEWPAYGNDAGGSRYSPLAQINRDNVSRLAVAWTYHTGDIATRANAPTESAFETTPLYVDGTLYLNTPFGRVIALDPERGTARWTYDPKVDITRGYGDFASRGVSTWVDRRRAPTAACRRRIFDATIDARLIALDAATGAPCADFGARGAVNLREGLRNGIVNFSEYEETSPPAVIGDLVIVGSGIADNNRVTMPSGVVRAFDARTGALRWSWEPIPQSASDPAYATWRGPKAHTTGAANAWSIITADTARGLVFIPTGAASPDYYGGERLGQNLYANSVVALHAATGRMVWHFQVVHHDLWDYDIPAAPLLITVHRDGKSIPAVVVTTKIGHVFVLDRETGAPLFPVEERAVPGSDVPGEEAWATQPFPVLPAPLDPERVTPGDAWGLTQADSAWCSNTIASLRHDGPFTPPSVGGTLVVPGNIGGSNWGGMASDPERGLLFLPTNNLPAVIRLVPRARFDSVSKTNPAAEFAHQTGTPYGLERQFLLSPSRMPCTRPPWSTLTAIDLATGAVVWRVPFGTIPWAPHDPRLHDAGSVTVGGAMVTAGGLIFMGASLDNHIRAFDESTGAQLWEGTLPVAGKATPMTYRAPNGTQYVVITAGGYSKTGLPLGDAVVAFALR